MEFWRTAIYNGEVFDSYEVSNLGRIRSLKYRGVKGRVQVLKCAKDKDGYLHLSLRKNSKVKNCFVHRLVACTFIENNDETKTQVNHINELKEDCRVENLEWCSPKENSNHGTRSKRVAKKQAKKIIGKSLTENKVVVFCSMNQAERFGFKQSEISKCCRGKNKSHHGYVWSYM